jgi:gamma-glutamyl phosphate reductase
LLLTQIISQAATDAGVPEYSINAIETTDRAATQHMVTLNGWLISSFHAAARV